VHDQLLLQSERQGQKRGSDSPINLESGVKGRASKVGSASVPADSASQLDESTTNKKTSLKIANMRAGSRLSRIAMIGPKKGE